MKPAQAAILNAITAYWKAHPNERFGQMLTNFLGVPYISITTDVPEGRDLFHVQDADILEWIEREENL